MSLIQGIFESRIAFTNPTTLAKPKNEVKTHMAPLMLQKLTTLGAAPTGTRSVAQSHQGTAVSCPNLTVWHRGN